jgi:dolichol-phosphate mannosyltransferase
MKKVIITLPTFNERENVEKLVYSIQEISKQFKEVDLGILIVDDDSPDGTGQIADQLTKRYKNVYVKHRKIREGLGKAYIDGFNYALTKLNADHVFSMDCDLSHDPKYLPNFMKEINNYDIIIGSRYIPGGGTYRWPLHRRIISHGANWLAKTILGLQSHDCTSGYRCYSKNTLMSINFENIKSTGYSFLVEILYRCQKKRLKVYETPFVFVDRKFGDTKMAKKEIYKTLYTLIRLRFKG